MSTASSTRACSRIATPRSSCTVTAPVRCARRFAPTSPPIAASRRFAPAKRTRAATASRSRSSKDDAYTGSVRWLALVVVLAGGNALFGLDDVCRGVDAAGDFVPCTPLPFDPARYAQLGPGYTWQNARELCLLQGFDLAVLDDGDGPELANEINGAQLPFWVGVDYGTDW